MKKEKKLSKADALKVLEETYLSMKNGDGISICLTINSIARKYGLADKEDWAYELIPELGMFKPINKSLDNFWYPLPNHSEVRLYIVKTLIDIYNGDDHPDMVEKIARKIRSIF